MEPVSVVDLVGFLAILAALIILWRGWKRALGRDAKLLFAGLLALALFHGFSNVLEWSGITEALDPFEDFVQLLEPMLWGFFFYAFLQEIAERDLRESEEKYRCLVESANDAMFVADAETGIILDVNKRAEDLLGLPTEKIVGMHQTQLHPKEEAERYRRLFLEHVQRERATAEGLFVCHQDGRQIPVDISASVVEIEGRRILQGIFHDITERVRAEEALRQYTERLRILREIDQAILAARSPQAVAQAALAHVRELAPCQRASVTTFDQEVEEATVLAVYTNGETVVEAGARVPLDTFGLTGELEQGQAYTVDDLRTVSTPSPMEQKLLAGNVRSYVNVPLVAQGELIGTLNLGAVEPAAFGKQQIEIAHEVADQLAVAIQQARLHEQAQRRLQELLAIYQAAQRLQRLHTPETLAQEIVAVLEQTLDYEYGAIILVDEPTGQLIPFALSNQGRGPAFVEADKAYVASHSIRLGEGITGWVAQTGQSVRLGDVRQDPRYYALRDDIRSELCVPLRVGDKILGVVNVETTRLNAYTEGDQRVLETVAAQVAIALQNARLYEQVQRHAGELEGRVAKRTAELNERMAEVEGLNRAMTNLLNDLQASNRKLAETGRQLERMNKELETFTYSVSHDLKAPLRGIDGYSRLLLQDHAGQLDDEGRTFLHTIRRAAEQMNQLIEDLLAYSRLERRAMRTTSINPRALVEALVAEHAKEIRERGVGLTVEVPCQAVMAETEGLTQVLRNLIGNALKFTRDAPEPRIEIGGRDAEKTCILWVRDNGIGFDMLYHDRIFEIFQRLHRAEEYPGTGVGLAIARKAMQRMGGRVWAESAPSEGATFFLEIPREREGRGAEEQGSRGVERT